MHIKHHLLVLGSSVALLALCLLAVPAPSPAVAAETPTIVKNIKTDFGATCNGTADDSTSFTAFNTWAKSWQASTTGGLIELDIPSGSTCIFGNGASGRWTVGIKKMIVKGYGATMKGNSFLGGLGIAGDLNHHAYANSASAGATSITLKNSSDASKFTLGNWVVLTGLDLQGFWNGAGYGYPPNAEYFDYLQITGINGATISFAQSLKYDYKDTWPQYDFGGRFGNPEGGPPTLYALDPSWNTEVEYAGMTFDFTGGQTYSNGRQVVFRDVTVKGGSLIPTQNLSWSAINSDLTVSFMEADKLVTNMTLENSKLGSVDFQSSSIDLFTMNNSEITRFIHGMPKKFVATNSKFKDFGPGTLWYGHTDEVVCTNCVISKFMTFGFNVSTAKFSAQGSTVVVPNTESSQVWAVPGTHLFVSGRTNQELSFYVTGVTQDANNTYVQTTLPSDWQSLPKWNDTTPLSFTADAAPKFTCTNCTGDPTVVDLSQAPVGAPLYSYSKRTYSGNLKVQSGPTVRGKIVSIKINVTKPYTGTKPTLIAEALGQFGLFVMNPDRSISRPDPRINLKIAGERVITPTGVTGVQTGDDFTASWGTPTWKTWDVWINGYSIAVPDLASEDSSTWPTFTIEVITDPGVTNTPTTPRTSTTPVVTNTPTVTTTPTPTVTTTPTPTTSTTPTTNTTQTVGDLLPPQSLRVTSITSTSLTIRWRAPEDSRIVSYNVYRDGVKLTNISATRYTDNTVAAGKKYRYIIESVDASGNLSKQVGISEQAATSGTVTTTKTTTTPSVGSTPTPTTSGVTTNQIKYIVSNLGPGSSGTVVAALQKFLIADDYLVMPAGTSLGYYGSLTQKAVQAFQTGQQIVSSGTPSLNGFGAVGPRTLVAINTRISGDTSLISAVLAPTPTSTVTPATLVKPTTGNSTPVSKPVTQTVTKTTPVTSTQKCDASAVSGPIGSGVLPQNLSLGACSAQVITLQEILNSFGFPVAEAGQGSLGKEDTYYSQETANAVAKFQEKYGLTKDKRGVLGEETREKLNYMFANGLNPRYTH